MLVCEELPDICLFAYLLIIYWGLFVYSYDLIVSCISVYIYIFRCNFFQKILEQNKLYCSKAKVFIQVFLIFEALLIGLVTIFNYCYNMTIWMTLYSLNYMTTLLNQKLGI